LINETAIKINKMGPNEKIAFALFFQVKQEILSCFDMEDQREILKKLIEDLQDFQESLQP
jgi:hypothetical protein